MMEKSRANQVQGRREGEEGGVRVELELQGGVGGLERAPGSEEGVDRVEYRFHLVNEVVCVALLDEADLAVDGPDPTGALVLLEELHEGVGGSGEVLRQIEALDAKGLFLVVRPREGVFAHDEDGRFDGRCGEVDDDGRGRVGPGGGWLVATIGFVKELEMVGTEGILPLVLAATRRGLMIFS
jgi:hypothetical protein